VCFEPASQSWALCREPLRIRAQQAFSAHGLPEHNHHLTLAVCGRQEVGIGVSRQRHGAHEAGDDARMPVLAFRLSRDDEVPLLDFDFDVNNVHALLQRDRHRIVLLCLVDGYVPSVYVTWLLEDTRQIN